jgi:coenzyme F420 hydrogenase subunit beta
VLSALSLYCLEVERMEFVLHTGMDPDKPWRNLTVVSRTREELLSRAGSRYTPSSPCEQLKLIENASGPCVFIGRPCDAAAAMALRKIRPQLDRNLGLVLTFFCAGAPCSKATLDLLQQHGIESRDIESIRYRGNGWPGLFSVEQPRGSLRLELTYDQTWGYLAQKFRSFRCNLCPDGLGEISDIASGDAWHRRAETSNPGESIVIARSGRGQEILRMAEAHGYLELQPSSPDRVVEAQELVKRRFEVYGRLVGLRLMGVPVPAFDGFHLSKAWTRHTTSASKFKTILGTIKRVLVRGLWHKNPLPNN